ncbi:MAG: hypothetical protein QJR05_05915 [Thermoanaerobacterium sp.]|nr:hypothetical protein [Thermoanaerobacterium sp.]
MWGGYKISHSTKEDIANILDWITKASDSLELGDNKKRTQLYIKKAIEICEKYIS